MGRQPFERKSLWHLSAPCYHIHISRGDNFETACTAQEPVFWLGPAKMKKPLLAFKVFLSPSAFQRHPLVVKRAALDTVGTGDLLPLRESNWGGREAASWQGRDLGRCERDGLCQPPGPDWSHAENVDAACHCAHGRLPQGLEGLRGSIGCQLTGLNSKHANTMQIPCSHFFPLSFFFFFKFSTKLKM